MDTFRVQENQPVTSSDSYTASSTAAPFLIRNIVPRTPLNRFIPILACFGVIILLCISQQTAMAGPCTQVGDTISCTGDQSTGINLTNPPVTTLEIRELNPNLIQPSGANVPGVRVKSTTGMDVTVKSGVSQTNVIVNTGASQASGIVVESSGSPPSPANDPFLNVPIPGDPKVPGGVVRVESYSDITTTGSKSHGIAAYSNTTGYPSSVVTALENFSDTGISFTVTSVKKPDGSEGGIATPVTGKILKLDDNGQFVGYEGEAGTFSLNANGTYSFTQGAAFDDLAVGKSRTVSVNYSLNGYRSGVLRQSGITGELFATVKKTDSGFETVMHAYFDDFGESDKPQTDNKALPDLQRYVDGLIDIATGAGGAGNSVTATHHAGVITTKGTASHGVVAESKGKTGSGGRNGGGFWSFGTRKPTAGGDGNRGGNVTVTVDGTIVTESEPALDKPDDASLGVFAHSLGGTGGRGGNGGTYYNGRRGGAGGTGGTVKVYGNAVISTRGHFASGILALSEGGDGGNGGDGGFVTDGQHGGFGGGGGKVIVDGNWDIETKGDNAHGIWAKSTGGKAGTGGSGGWLAGAPAPGGQASDADEVTVKSGGEIITRGKDSFGIYGQSVGGFGGSGGSGGSIFYTRGGDGNSAGSGGAVSVTNKASGSITTYGEGAHALHAQSVGGGGGSGGGAGAIVGVGGSGAAGGHGGIVDAINDGIIKTFGLGARGIYAQSIGGGGGDGGNSSGLVSIGGGGSGTSDGKKVTVTNAGEVETQNIGANAIFAQSIGGGGGSGGSSSGWFSIGGSGGGGGHGGEVVVTNSGETLKTAEVDATAIYAQSIGGGGGKGGNSVAVGAFISMAIGGEGAAGGKGDKVRVDSLSGEILTSGSRSHGIFAQSIGGGGGDGGYAVSASVGVGGSVSIGVGGRGGGGGDSNQVNVVNHSHINTKSKDADGIFAESVGGGGGTGGFTISGAASDGLAVSFALGGNGGSGGDGKAVDVRNFGLIETGGDRSVGLQAQSVGGGGGNGGFVISASGAGVGALSFGIGGTAGGGGESDTVRVENDGRIETRGKEAHGLLAQSLGGGGGNGGFTIAAAGAGTGAGSLGIGGGGGGGGDSKSVTVISRGAIETSGDSAVALFAQSVGGGGGNGGFSIAGAGAGIGAGTFSLGGKGDVGGNADEVTVSSGSKITTHGVDAQGIFAQSLGGGGGNGGFSIAAAGAGTGAGTLGIGGSGKGGGDSKKVTVTSTGETVETVGNRSTGILAQSLGGGGGNGGFSIAGAGAGTGAGTFSLGGSGDKGGNAEAVTVTSSSRITTHGVDAQGIFAQSLGGGGGNGGFSIAAAGAGTGAGTLGIGGSGKGGGNSKDVTVTSTGESIETVGDRSTGILAQSLGGGGGNGGFSIAGAGAGTGAGTFSLGGSGDKGGNAEAVTVTSSSRITTHGVDAQGIFAQSLGGGGGNGGFSVAGAGAGKASGSLSIGGSGGPGGSSQMVTVTSSGARIQTSGDRSIGIQAQSLGGGGGNGGFAFDGAFGEKFTLSAAVGGSGGDGGAGSAVHADNSSAITTDGSAAHAIFAQSVGGGGGTGGMSITAGFGAFSSKNPWNVNASVSVGGAGGDGSRGGDVTVGFQDSVAGELRTSGDTSHGIFAQSIGGGGGQGGASLLFTFDTDVQLKKENSTLTATFAFGGTGGKGNIGGNVQVNNASDIDTTGDSSHGIFAQSIGGGGGNGGSADAINLSTSSLLPLKDSKATNWALNVSAGGDGGDANKGGTVSVVNEGRITTEGMFSRGIFAQSIGGGGGSVAESVLGKAGDWIDAGQNILGALGVAKTLYETFKEKDASGLVPHSLSITVGGSGGKSADADAVSVNNSGDITTTGLESHAIFAQSVGGGGGEAQAYAKGMGTGEDVDVGIGLVGEFAIGGAGGAAGNGSTVNVTNSGAITTWGENAKGIYAQSIGGGGGQAGAAQGGGSFSTDSFTDFLQGLQTIGFGAAFGRDGGSSGNGGTVNVVNQNRGDIVTHGKGATGIFAQSIGGGGGGLVQRSGIAFFGSVGGYGSGGAVTVTNYGNITTSGDEAHGIFAQSAGGNETQGYAGSGGTVNVALERGDITVKGANADGILAQSVGMAGGGNITINVNNGMVQGGSGLGTGVRMLDGATNTLTNRGTITTVGGISGNAIIGTRGNEVITNYGTVTGNIDLGTGTNSFINRAQAHFSPGATVNLGAGNTLTNTGTLSPGGAGTVLTTVLASNFVQTNSATLAIDVNSANGSTDLLDVKGTATLDGKVAVKPVNTGRAAPGTWTSTILLGKDGVINADKLILDVPKSQTIGYQLLPSNGDLKLQTTVNFHKPGLNGPQAGIGEYINRIQSSGGSDSLAPIIEEIFKMSDSREVASAYEHLSPDSYAGATGASSASVGQYMQTLSSRMQGIRSFGMTSGSNLRSDIQLDKAVLLAYNGSDASIGQLLDIRQRREAPERYGVWIDGFGRWGDQKADPGFTGFNYRTAGSALGLDFLIGDRVIIGVSGGYSYTSIDLDDNKGDGSTRSNFGSIYGSYFTKQFYLETALSYARQDYHNKRNIVVGALQTQANSKHDGDSYSASLSGGYNFAIEKWLVQPLASMHYTYLTEEDFHETGAGGVNLIVADRATESLVSELGLRVARVFQTEKGTLIPEVRAVWTYDFGLDDRVVTAAFEGSPNTSFAITGQAVERHGATFGLGITFVQGNGFSATLKYDAEMREDYRSHGLFGELRWTF